MFLEVAQHTQTALCLTKIEHKKIYEFFYVIQYNCECPGKRTYNYKYGYRRSLQNYNTIV